MQLHVPPSRNGQILITTEVGGNPKEGSVHTKHSTEWRPLPYERREKAENRLTKKMQNGGGGRWRVRRGRYSHTWLLWLGTLQGSRRLRLHLSFKIAAAFIYLVGGFHPVSCPQDHCGCPITGNTVTWSNSITITFTQKNPPTGVPQTQMLPYTERLMTSNPLFIATILYIEVTTHWLQMSTVTERQCDSQPFNSGV